MFFGTPHDGGNIKGWREIAKKYKALGPKCKMIDVLTKNTDDLIEIDEDFRQLSSKYAIVNFYETHIMEGAKSLVVDKTSANLTFSLDFQSLPVEANHISMCKFIDDSDEPFKAVCRVVEEAGGVKAIGEEDVIRETVNQEAIIKEIVVKEIIIREVGIKETVVNAKGQEVPAITAAEEVKGLQAPQATPQQRILELPQDESNWGTSELPQPKSSWKNRLKRGYARVRNHD
jgi:hypothetical protein